MDLTSWGLAELEPTKELAAFVAEHRTGAMSGEIMQAATRCPVNYLGVAHGSAHVHVRTERGFRPAQKAYPALLVEDIEAVERTLTAAGHPCRFPENSVGPRHFHSHDPLGNRLEFRQA